MNLTLHLIRKDLRHFRLAAVFWAILVAAQIILTNRLLLAGPSDGDWYMLMSGFVNLLYFLGLVFGYLFAGMIVLADAPAGSVSHWQTRPVSGGRQLAAKSITAFLIIGVLPVLLWLPWWIYCGFGLGGIVQTAAVILAVNLMPAVVGAALAVVVDQLGRFMMLTMILVAALLVFAMTALVPSETPSTLIGTRMVLGLVCLLLSALLAVAVQYRTRRVLWSGGILAAGVVVILFIRTWWPLDLVTSAVRYWNKSSPPLNGTAKITGRIWSASLEARNNKDGQSEPFIAVSLGLAGVPEDLYVSGGVADVELSWPDGTKVRREQVKLWEHERSNRGVALRHALGFGPERYLWPKSWDPETEAKLSADNEKRDRRIREQSAGKKMIRREVPADLTTSLKFEIPVSPPIATKVRLASPVCRVSAIVETKRPVILGEMPLVEGAAIVRDGRVTLAKFQSWHRDHTWPGQLEVWYGGALTSVKPAFSGDRAYYLIDREHETVGWSFGYNVFQGVPPLAGSLVYNPVNFQPPSLWRGDHWVEVPGWQKTFALVEEEARPAGNFIYSLTAERLELTELAEE
jgi:hypothetical protein